MSPRVEPFTIGNFAHVYNRGIKKGLIFFSKSDYWRFLWCLRFFNEERSITELSRCLTSLVASQKKALLDLGPRDYRDGHNTFEWRSEWGEYRPLVEIISYHLSPNHFHLLLKEIEAGGISNFMRKLGIGYTEYQGLKSGEPGRIFQGAYKGRTVDKEEYLQYLDAYIQVLNAFELFHGGIENALRDFDRAFEFALNYPFCSLGETFGMRNLNIIKRECFNGVFNDLQAYKEFCKDALIVRNARSFLEELSLSID